ncbi:DUF1365 domain-containing protein [Thioalkalivibrio paradoxus]|uniref:DUF1365 domain-containing protein n=1 Tax=Thioalkalivibrio paradoxus ARh 1 TaxID=713585 RepID=W0DK06_9GAMM|nr:DUF1365 domain-containing protein [Thioalkalivibrio paradoxus]AHE97577.1 hypothetical protein THITH_04090 [Thioalkalivibrio paradoxus ARh 1]
MSAPAHIYHCQVMHQRLFPVAYRFRYRLFTMLFDIDRLEALAQDHRWFSKDRFNLFSLYTRDHGRRDGSPWRPWIEAVLARHAIRLEGGRIRLLAMPRILGHAFNPLSIWYCEHRDGTARAALLEVRNTFGEHHHYLLHNDGAPLTWPVRGEKPKRFHVSPFIGMQARYAFRLQVPAESLGIAIREYEHQDLLLVASQSGRRQEFTDRALLRILFTMPWATARILLLIHWQALKIWLRGGRFHRKPGPPTQEIS